MPGSARYTNQVATLYLNRGERALARVDVKQPAATDDKTHFVFTVPMLTAEFRQHDFEVRCFRSDIDHIRHDVSPALFELCYLLTVNRQNLFG